MNIDTPEKKHIPQLKKLWKESFGDTDDTINIFFKTAFSTKRCMCFYADGNIVASLYWFNCTLADKPIAYIYAISTAKAYRGQGICHKLMEYTHSYLLSHGYVGAVLVPADDGLFKFYESMGYTVCSSIGQIFCEASSSAAEIREIDKHEYAYLRRQFLPRSGVVQEGENLDYLSALAQFYAGDDFLVAVVTEDDALNGIELLGNTSRAAHITNAFKCKKGRFRIMGDEHPFAMYKPLDNSKREIPSYFGLSFD